jgi:hypothetical protein
MAFSLGGVLGHIGTGGVADGVWAIPVTVGGILGGICLFLLVLDALSGTGVGK